MKDRQIFDGSGGRDYLAAQLEEKKTQVRFKGIESTFKLVSKAQIELGEKINVLVEGTTGMGFRECVKSRNSTAMKEKYKAPL